MRTPASGPIIITGSGGKAFCAGADIGAFDFDPEKARAFLIAALEVLTAPENTRKPVISAVNGICLWRWIRACDGVGLYHRIGPCAVRGPGNQAWSVARACDRAASGHRRPGQGEGNEHASAILSRRRKPADSALCCAWLPHDSMLADAIAFAERIASKPKLAVQMAKSFYNRGLGGDEMRHADRWLSASSSCTRTHERGIAAFREKRDPNSATNEPRRPDPDEGRYRLGGISRHDRPD